MKSGFNLSSENNSSDPRLPKCIDLYLCDICGKDFDELQSVLVRSFLISKPEARNPLKKDRYD
jgi:hypothetical protein